MSYFHKQNLDYLSKTLGTYEEWDKAFNKFCRKKENIYGLPVDRNKIKEKELTLSGLSSSFEP